MKSKRFVFWSILGLISVLSMPLQARLVGKKLIYKDGKTLLRGYLVYDTKFKGKRPGVLVVHEWWGHTQYARNRAKQLAKQGYVAFALDMYGRGKVAQHPKQAKEFSSQIFKTQGLMQSRFRAAYDFLAKQKRVDTSKIGAIGFCFGGAVVLEMARRGEPLVAVGVFHGGLATKFPAVKGEVKAKIFVATGAADKFIPMEQVDAFKKEMQDAGASVSIHIYKNAKHAFTNPRADRYAKKFKMPIGYNKKAANAAWNAFLKFFADAVK